MGLFAADRPASISRLRQLRFSPDGKYVIAQDDAEIAVLSAEPFAAIFHVPAENSTLAQFTADSREILFVSSTNRSDPTRLALTSKPPQVERWNIQEKTRSAPVPLHGAVCGSLALSPDGKILACDDFEGTLRVIDVASGGVLFERPRFVRPFPSHRPNPDSGQGRQPGSDRNTDLSSARLEFSPDSRFLLAMPGAEGPSLAVEIPTRQTVTLRGTLRVLDNDRRGALDFAGFVIPDQLLVSAGGLWDKKHPVPGRKNEIVSARLVDFPSGNLISTVKIPWSGVMRRAADPAWVILTAPSFVDYRPRPYPGLRLTRGDEGAVAIELSSGESIVSATAVMDVFGDRYVAEVRPGEIGLYERSKGLHASVVLDNKK